MKSMLLVLSVLLPGSEPVLDDGRPLTDDQILAGLRLFAAKTARPDGSFGPGADPEYGGMSDSAASDLAPPTYAVIVHRTFGWTLPNEAQTRAFFLNRQQKDGAFVNELGTLDPRSPGARLYNTTQGLVALHGLGIKPRFDPLPVFTAIMEGDYKELPPYTTSFFPLAYATQGKPFPVDADKKIRALMVQDKDGYMHSHVANTFHLAHYYSLMKKPTPLAEAMIARTLRDQKQDGSWVINPLARDRHATFDAVFTLKHLGKERSDCQQAIARAGRWALSCRNPDGGFGHYPGSPSDWDAVYFQVGTLVMAGVLPPARPLPSDARLLGWGHLLAGRE
jgi:geranylgeranyl transferase type-2 subunit beta